MAASASDAASQLAIRPSSSVAPAPSVMPQARASHGLMVPWPLTTSVTRTSRSGGTPRWASSMAGTVVTRSSSMMRGLVSATSAPPTTRGDRLGAGPAGAVRRLPPGRPGRRRGMAGNVPSDRHAVAIELVVLVESTLPPAQVLKALDELDGLDPLDHLEAQLDLVSQPQGRAV